MLPNLVSAMEFC